MRTTVTIEDGTVILVHFQLRDWKVYQTVEVMEGVCLVDESKSRDALGIEILNPNYIMEAMTMVANLYSKPDLVHLAEEFERMFNE